MARLRILSINLLVDRADPDDLRRVLGATDPDVVCVQELGPSVAEVLTDILPFGRMDPRKDLFGLGIAARGAVGIDRLEMEQRSGWIARLEPDDWPELAQPLDVFNVHLINPIDRPWRATRDVRQSQVARIAAAVEERDVASVVIGDMNASPVWREYKMLAEIGVDAARSTGTARRTWSQFLFGPRLLRIDHAFVSRADPVTTSTLRVAGTDHSALVVDLDV
jgi:endonuclease/exonuclease/phosphatase family metal-dependent hydrolase